MGAIASQITSLTIVYSTVYSDADQRKHQSSASLAFVRGIHRGPVNFPHKCAGWDDLRPRIMKFIQSCIKRPLAHICNRSFITGIFPSELKIANVVPIFKSGDDMVFSNYRPVSVLPVLSKILERLV